MGRDRHPVCLDMWTYSKEEIRGGIQRRIATRLVSDSDTVRAYILLRRSGEHQLILPILH
jgi:hypothetical protein